MREDHEELKILPKNCLIASRFNQELILEREEHHFIRKYPARDCIIRFTVIFVSSDYAEPMESWPTTRSTFSLNFARPMKIRRS